MAVAVVNSWEVRASTKLDWCDSMGPIEVWRGKTWAGALWALIQAKRKGYGYVTLNWRGKSKTMGEPATVDTQ